MTTFLSRYATPFTTGLFLVSLISGLALFFHVGPSGFHGMHEILSLALILPFGLHVWKNWRPMSAYLKHAPMGIALALSLAMSLPFLIPQGDQAQGGRPAQFALIQAVMAGTPAELAPALHTTPEALVGALQTAGFDGAKATLPLTEIASQAGKDTGAVAAALVAGLQKP
jgi:hypothetical protein